MVKQTWRIRSLIGIWEWREDTLNAIGCSIFSGNCDISVIYHYGANFEKFCRESEYGGFDDSCRNTLQHTATHCSALQRTATHCNTLQHTAICCNILQHTATHCNTLQHTAPHCNKANAPSLQKTPVLCWKGALFFLDTFARSKGMTDTSAAPKMSEHILANNAAKCVRSMGCLRLVGSLKLQVSFAEYSLFYRDILRKRPMFLGSLLIVDTPHKWASAFLLWMPTISRLLKIIGLFCRIQSVL